MKPDTDPGSGWKRGSAALISGANISGRIQSLSLDRIKFQKLIMTEINYDCLKMFIWKQKSHNTLQEKEIKTFELFELNKISSFIKNF